MVKQHIHAGVENPDQGFERFVKAWNQAQDSEPEQQDVHLNFEDLSMLLSVLTPKRLELLKAIRQAGPLSIRALSKNLKRDYKNVHTDTGALEEVGLIERAENGELQAPWDVIDAHLSLVA